MTRPRPRLWMIAAVVWITTEAAAGVALWGSDMTRGLTYDPVIETLSEAQRERLRQFLRGEGGLLARQHPVLGWVPVSEANAAGMRDDREYDSVPPPGKIRIAAFGDSFTYGSDVSLPESWLRQLASLEPALEVLNYGAGAYGLDQAYLRYRLSGTDYQPHLVLIGYMSENIARNVNVFRPFYTSSYRDVIFTKPRFELQGGALTLLENPISTREDHERLLNHDTAVLRELGEHDYHYQISYRAGPFDVLPSVRFAKMFWYYAQKSVLSPIVFPRGVYNVESEAFRVTTAIFDAFYREVLANGALPVIVVFPDIYDQRDSRAKRERRYRPLLDWFDERDYPFVDFLDAFRPVESRHSVEELTVDWGHFSPLAGRFASQHLLTELRERNYLDLSAVHRAIRDEQSRLGVSPKPSRPAPQPF